MTAPRPPRPRAAQPDLARIPAHLAAQDRWASWIYYWNRQQSRWKKLPLNPATGRAAAVNDLGTFGSFTDASAAMQQHGHDGVGYLLGPGDIGIDLDDCVRPDGTLQTWAAYWVRVLCACGGYAEYSVSVTGVHILLRGSPPWGPGQADTGYKRAIPPQSGEAGGSAEIYSERRYLCTTGRPLPQGPSVDSTVGSATGTGATDATDTLQRFSAWLLSHDTASARKAPPAMSMSASTTTPSSTSSPQCAPGLARSPRLATDDILRRCREMKNEAGEDFRRLYDTPPGPSRKEGGSEDRSQLDWRLADKLSFWSQDIDQLADLMMRSARRRDEWDTPRAGDGTALRYTLRRCLERRLARGPIYTGPRERGPAPWTQEEIAALPEETKNQIIWSVYHACTNPTLDPSDSRVAIATWFSARRFPGVEPPASEPLVRLGRDDLAHASDLSADRTGKILKHLHEVQAIRRCERSDPSGHTALYFGAPPEPLLNTTVVPPAAHRAKDRARKQCRDCGASCFHVVTHCANCGSMRLDETIRGDDAELVKDKQEALEQKHSAEGWSCGIVRVAEEQEENQSSGPQIPAGQFTQFLATAGLVLGEGLRLHLDRLDDLYDLWCRRMGEEVAPRAVLHAWLADDGFMLHDGFCYGLDLSPDDPWGPSVESTLGSPDAPLNPDGHEEQQHPLWNGWEDNSPDPTVESTVGCAQTEGAEGGDAGRRNVVLMSTGGGG